MSENEKLNDDEMKRIVQEQENQEQINDPYLANAQRLKESAKKDGLGKVDTKKSKGGRIDSEDASSDLVLGYHNIHISDLPSKGLFYPLDVDLQIRPAKVAEIRHFSTLQERDLFDVDEKLNHILQNCTKMRTKTRVMSWKDILEVLFNQIQRFEAVMLFNKQYKTENKEDWSSIVTDEQPYTKIVFAQIKEKFGGIRIYYDGGDHQTVRNLVREAENLADITCESCGATDFVKKQNNRGWIYTSCDNCKRPNR